MQSDQELWIRVKEGDEVAFGLLYDRYFQVLFQYGRRLTPDRDLVKDAIQDLFVNLWRNRLTLNVPNLVKQYLLRSLRNRVFRQLQTAKEDIDADTDELTEESVESSIIREEVRHQQTQSLHNALAKLTRRQREAISLKYYSNCSYDEITSIMGIRKEAVYVLISKALDVLQGYVLLNVLPWIILACSFEFVVNPLNWLPKAATGYNFIGWFAVSF